jgi:hypothetical protein
MEENNLESLETPAVEEAVENASVDDALKVETLFFIVKDLDGSYKAITDISKKIELSRSATIQDIRTGCQDIVRAIDIRQSSETTALMVASIIKNQAQAQ